MEPLKDQPMSRSYGRGDFVQAGPPGSSSIRAGAKCRLANTVISLLTLELLFQIQIPVPVSCNMQASVDFVG